MKLLSVLILTLSFFVFSSCSHMHKGHHHDKAGESCCKKNPDCMKGCKADKSCCNDECKKCDGKSSCKDHSCELKGKKCDKSKKDCAKKGKACDLKKADKKSGCLPDHSCCKKGTCKLPKKK